MSEKHALFHIEFDGENMDTPNFGCLCGERFRFGLVESNIHPRHPGQSPLWHLAFVDFDERYPPPVVHDG